RIEIALAANVVALSSDVDADQTIEHQPHSPARDVGNKKRQNSCPQQLQIRTAARRAISSFAPLPSGTVVRSSAIEHNSLLPSEGRNRNRAVGKAALPRVRSATQENPGAAQ